MASVGNTAIPERIRPRDRVVARVPVFYGWVMLPIALIAQVATSPGQSFTIAVFNQSFTDSIGLSQKQLTGAFGLGTLLASFTLPFFGALMDRWGIRRSMALVVGLLGCACIVASQANSLLVLFAAFFLLRMFGQGALSLFANNTVAMWFRERLGMAVGVMSVGCILIMGQVPAFVRQLIDHFGWRWAYALLGVAVWIVMFPILAFLFRNRPEEVGQAPDGLHVDGAAEEHRKSNVELQRSLDLAAAIRTRTYWIMATVQSCWAMVGTGLVFNAQSLFVSKGLSDRSAVHALTCLFTCMALMQLVGGILADRCRLYRLIALSMTGLTAGIGILLFGRSEWSLVGYIVFGASQGLLSAAANTLWPRYFGRAHVGKIRGSMMTAVVAGSAIGPFLMGMSFDWFESYAPSLWLFGAILVPLSVSALFATPPDSRSSV